MNAELVTRAIIERCTGAAASAAAAIPLGSVYFGNAYSEDANHMLALTVPRVTAEVVSSTVLTRSAGDLRTHRLVVEVALTHHYSDLSQLPDDIRRQVIARAPELAAAVSDALTERNGLLLTADGQHTLVVTGRVAEVVRSAGTQPSISRGDRGAVLLKWTMQFALYVESCVASTPVMSSEGFSDANYWQASTHFGGNPIGTKRFVLRVTGVSDAGSIVSHRRAWSLTAYDDGLAYSVVSFTAGSYVSQIDALWAWPTELEGGIVVVHGVCDGTTEALYVGGVLVSNVVTVDAAPTTQPAEVLTIGRSATTSGLSTASFGVCHIESTADVMSAGAIARDAALCMSAAPQRARFPAMSGSEMAFDARDASGSTWASQRNASHVLIKTGTTTWRPL